MISMPPFLYELAKVRCLLRISIWTKGSLRFKGQAACGQDY